MLFGWREADTVYVGAADTLHELNRFYDRQIAMPTKLGKVADLEPGNPFSDMVLVSRVFECASPAIADSILNDVEVIELTRPEIADKQIDLVRDLPRDAWLDAISREPTLGELLGIAPKIEPDVIFRTTQSGVVVAMPNGLSAQDEELRRENADLIRRAQVEVKRTGSIQTDNFVVFAVGQSDLHGDGQLVTIAYFVLKRRTSDDNARARPCPAEHLALPGSIAAIALGVYQADGLSPEQVTDQLKHLGYHNDATAIELFDPSWVRPARGRALAIERGHQFFRINVPGVGLDDLEAVWTNEDWSYASRAAGYGEETSLVWYAFVSQGAAARFRTRIQQHGFAASLPYMVDISNLPATPVDAVEPVLVRPWTDAAAIAAMTPEQREANKKSYSAKEFMFARVGSSVSGPTRFVVVPKDYFHAHRRLWEERLDIAHLLPESVREHRAGSYTSTMDWPTLDASMRKHKQFGSHFLFNVFANKL